jgi:hypothetical protein
MARPILNTNCGARVLFRNIANGNQMTSKMPFDSSTWYCSSLLVAFEMREGQYWDDKLEVELVEYKRSGMIVREIE